MSTSRKPPSHPCTPHYWQKSEVEISTLHQRLEACEARESQILYLLASLLKSPQMFGQLVNGVTARQRIEDNPATVGRKKRRTSSGAYDSEATGQDSSTAKGEAQLVPYSGPPRDI